MRKPERKDYVSEIAFDLAMEAFVGYVIAKVLESTETGQAVSEFIDDVVDFDWDD